MAPHSLASAQTFNWNFTAGSDNASGIFVVSLQSSSSGTSTYSVTGITNGTWDGIAINSVVPGTTFTSTGPNASQNTLSSPLEFRAGENDILYLPAGPVEFNATTETTTPAGPFTIKEAPWNPSDAVMLFGGAAFCVQGYFRRRRGRA
jgi:hypothetical protein